MSPNKPNFSPFFAEELNKIMGADYEHVGSYVTRKDDETRTHALVRNVSNGATRLLVCLAEGTGDDVEESIETNYLLKDKPLSLKNASTRFYASIQSLAKWLEALMTSGKITTADVVMDADDVTRVVAMKQPAIIALFMSRCEAAPRGRTSAQNVLVIDFAKGKRASAVQAAIARLLSDNGYDVSVFTGKEYSDKRKADRLAKAAAKTA